MDLRWMARIPAVATMVLVLLVSACGGGGGGSDGGGSSPPPGPAAPTGLTYGDSTQVWNLETAVTLNPTVNGVVSAYSISPTLPAGVTFNTTTGVIAGTPTALQAATSYTVTATNANGSTSVSLSITVKPRKAAFTYAPSSVTLTVDVRPSPPLLARYPDAGSPVAAYSVSPALPPGLTLNSLSGDINGVPTSAVPETTYTVSATNDGGVTTAELKLRVVPRSTPSVLLDLGHVSKVTTLRLTATRMLSQDTDSHWVLWDYHAATPGTMIAQGEAGCETTVPTCTSPRRVDLAGSVVAIETADGAQLRAATDGHVIASINAPHTSWRLATDGSYLVTSNTTSISVWSTTDGSLIFTRPGGYATADYYAAPGELRVGSGPTASVIENISVPGAVVTQSPAFTGQFYEWFGDGEHFFTSQASDYRIYSKAGALEDSFTQPGNITVLAGSDGWYWIGTGASRFDIYALGAAMGTPALTVLNVSGFGANGGPMLSDHSLLFTKSSSVEIVDLTQGTLPAVSHAMPFQAFPSAYAATGTSEWALASDFGAVIDGVSLATTPRQFALGKPISIAGGSQYFALSLASGNVRYFDSITLNQAGTLPLGRATLKSSTSGTVIAAIAADTSSVQLYELPSNNLVGTIPETILDYTLAGSGDRVGLTSACGPICILYVYSPSGAPLFAKITPPVPLTALVDEIPYIRLSPDGTLIATTDAIRDASAKTRINVGTTSTDVTGWGVDWIDDGRLLANNYGAFGYTTATIFDAAGTSLVSGLALPELKQIQRASESSVYSPERNQIFSLTSGGTLWSSGEPAFRRMGTVIPGNKVVYAAGSKIFVDTY